MIEFSDLDPLPTSVPPTYTSATSQFIIKVNLKQNWSFRRKDAASHDDDPLWYRLLGTAISREWLHSSGILSTYRIPVNGDMSFGDLDAQVRAQLRNGIHGGPWKRLRWEYLLRGRWLGKGSAEIRMLLDVSNWELSKAMMRVLLDVRLDLVFTVPRGRLRDCPPPGYSELELAKREIPRPCQNARAESAAIDFC